MILQNKMIRLISKAVGFIYVFLNWMAKPREMIYNNRILIIITGNLGDALMSIEAVLALGRYYRNEGRTVTVMTSRNIRCFLNMIADMNNFEFIDVNYPYSSNGTLLRELRPIVKAARLQQYEDIIVTWANAPIAKYLVAVIQHNNSWGVFDDIKRSYYRPKYFFEKAFTNRILVSIDVQEMQRYKIMLDEIGVRNYKVRIHHIKKLETTQTLVKPERKYITIAMDSMTTERRWPADEFKKTVQALLKGYDYEICCTGNDSALPIFHKCVEDLQERDLLRVHNYIGKTSLGEWIELLRGAEFHIGVDSGSIHVAAAVGTQAFCLVGVWDGTRVFPYQIDEANAGTCVPVPLYRSDVDPFKQPCYGCLSSKGHRGKGNAECYKGCNEGKPALCLQRITTTDLLSRISSYTHLNEGNE